LIDPELINDGKAMWLAPEVNFEEQYDSRCDIWSLGCLVFELITGNPPYWLETKGEYSKIMELMSYKSKFLRLTEIFQRSLKAPTNILGIF